MSFWRKLQPELSVRLSVRLSSRRSLTPKSRGPESRPPHPQLRIPYQVRNDNNVAFLFSDNLCTPYIQTTSKTDSSLLGRQKKA